MDPKPLLDHMKRNGIFGIILFSLVALGSLLLWWSGINANYREFLIFWAVFCLVLPIYFIKPSGSSIRYEELFPRYDKKYAFILSLLFQLGLSVVALLIMMWAFESFLSANVDQG